MALIRSLPLLLTAAVFWPGVASWPVSADAQSPQAAEPDARRLTCDVFQPGMTRDDLVARFGAAVVEDALLPVGEGMSQPGTTVFSGTPAHLDVFWNERPMMGGRTLTSVVVRAPGSEWSSIDGITIGTDLDAIERLNGGPFRLMGFAWDYQGTTMSWSDGKLAARDTDACRVRFRLRPDPAARDQHAAFYAQVTGAREYGSNHPAMQALNPVVYEMWLEIGRF